MCLACWLPWMGIMDFCKTSILFVSHMVVWLFSFSAAIFLSLCRITVWWQSISSVQAWFLWMLINNNGLVWWTLESTPCCIMWIWLWLVLTLIWMGISLESVWDFLKFRKGTINFGKMNRRLTCSCRVKNVMFHTCIDTNLSKQFVKILIHK